MSKTDKSIIYRTVFLGDEISDLLLEVHHWMTNCTISKERPNSFYFSQLVQSYDSELGYVIEVYHGWSAE